MPESALKLWGDGPNMAAARAKNKAVAPETAAEFEQRGPVYSRRSFGAADYSRITSSLVSESEHIMRIIRYQGRTLRARSRQVSMNTSWGAKFLQMVATNVCGPVPFKMSAKVKFASGKFDTAANDRIENEWSTWGKPGVCDFEQRLSWADIQRLAVRIMARDGECLIRIHEGTKAGPWGLQLQIIDTDRLDEDLNKELPDGNVIIAGVEVDTTGRTVAYHLLKRKPRDWHLGVARDYVRVPAEQIIHLFMPIDSEQVRGVPWMFAAILKLHQLGAFEEAAIIAARVGASKMGFYQQRPDMAYDGPPEGGARIDADGNYIQSAEPGEFGVVPGGYEFKDYNPNYPDAQTGPFLKALLRGLAASLGVSYHNFANDLESVNLSSARAGILEERDMWMTLQEFFKEHLHEKVYPHWLSNSLLRRKLPFALARLDNYLTVFFQPRRWPWIDPLKDVQANILAIKWGLKSRSEIVSETGRDIEDVFDQLKKENAMATDKEVAIAPPDEIGDPNAQDTDQDGE
jgi:lambda family phage portal protein